MASGDGGRFMFFLRADLGVTTLGGGFSWSKVVMWCCIPARLRYTLPQEAWGHSYGGLVMRQWSRN